MVSSRTPRAARDRYLEELQAALSRVSSAVLVAGPRIRALTGPVRFGLPGEPITLRRSRGDRVLVRIGLAVELAQAARGTWSARANSYIYNLYYDADPATEILTWHCHPDTRPDPHLHVVARHAQAGDLSKLHIPTGWMTFPRIVRFAIEAIGVAPIRADWDERLAGVERALAADEPR